MFEKFNDKARRTVVLAQHHARLLNHNYIGTEHLLLGLCADRDTRATRVLENLQVGLDDVEREVREIIGTGNSESSGYIPFTPRAKRVLELSFEESMRLRAPFIGPEHLLLGLLDEGMGVGAQVLDKKVGLDSARRAVLDLIEAEGADNTPPSGGTSNKTDGSPAQLVVEQILSALGRRATQRGSSKPEAIDVLLAMFSVAELREVMQELGLTESAVLDAYERLNPRDDEDSSQ